MRRQTAFYIRRAGRRYRFDVTLKHVKGRIEFVKADIALKDEIKAMQGARWHGHDESKRQMWSIADSPRNRFQIAYLEGKDVYAHFDQEVREHDLGRFADIHMSHQRGLTNAWLTYRSHIFAAEMGTGKTLAAQAGIELSDVQGWLWVGPLKTLESIRWEFRKFGFTGEETEQDGAVTIHGPKTVTFINYERLKKWIERPGYVAPGGVVFDEASRLRNHASGRSQAAQRLTDSMRDIYGDSAYVLLMTGTPASHQPANWWALCEIAYPGFLREGSTKQLKRRLAFIERGKHEDGVAFESVVSWKDDSQKCAVCGHYHTEGDEEDHKFKPSVNEVALLFKRLKGLVSVLHKRDCLDLPEKRYRTVHLEPSPSVKRVADIMLKTAPTVIQGLSQLRELSDGFQYREVKSEKLVKCDHCDGKGTVIDYRYGEGDPLAPPRELPVSCPKCKGAKEVPRIERIVKQVPCPKDDALRDLLDENEELGRLVVFGAFTGTIDRIVDAVIHHGWDCVRCDGRGFHTFHAHGTKTDDYGLTPLEFFDDPRPPRVAFVAHPESGGMGLTLTRARMAVFYSNSFKPEYRIQAEDRIHRKGMDENLGCEIVDLIHLPQDARVLEVIRANRRLELMTLGEFL